MDRHFSSFAAKEDIGNVGSRWERWLKRFDIFLRATKTTNDEQKKFMLLHYMGEDAYDIYDSLPGKPQEETYTSVSEALTNHFKGSINTDFEIFTFRQAVQGPSETIEAYYERLLKLSKNCEFSDLDKEIKSQIICHTSDKRLRKFALRESPTLETLLKQAKGYQATDSQALQMEGSKPSIPEETINRTFHSKSKFTQSNRPRLKHQPGLGSQQPSGSVSPRASGSNQARLTGQNNRYRPTTQDCQEAQSALCYFCGRSWPHAGGRLKCPAYGKSCVSCGKRGHFANVCNSSTGAHTRSNGHTAQTNQLLTSEVGPDSTSTSDGEIFTVSVNSISRNSNTPKVVVMVNGKNLPFTLDTGASVNIISSETLKKSAIEHKLSQTRTNIYSYGTTTSLPIAGCFEASLTKDVVSTQATIYVIEGTADSLLSYESALQLGLIQITANLTTVPDINNPLQAYKSQYPALFTGVGKLKNHQVHLHIDPSVPPVAQRHRRIPFHIQKAVEAEVNRLEQLDIIEPATGATPWVSPIVPVPKPHDPSVIRLCVDMRQANVAIKRERHITPTIDDIIATLNGATVFSKLDLNDGYHQLELDEESRVITTFSTHVGLKRYKRLNFGINAAAETFQNTVRQVLNGIPGVLNVSDDLLIYGKTKEDHDRALHATLQRLQESGFTVNPKKCFFNQSELLFFGYKFSAKGLEIDPDKIKAVVDASPPASVTEVRSFLGMVQFCAKFLPNLADLTAPLRNLTRADVPWSWTAQHQEAFDKLKALITKTSTLAYFNINKEIHLTVDAGPKGLGAILSQRSSNGSHEIVAFASRALTPVEERYSQIERELVSAVWGIEHFHLYLYGSTFSLHTDHKPLVHILNNPRSSTSARLERLCLRLFPYSFTAFHTKGSTNPSDYMSRHPVQMNQSQYRTSKTPNEYVQFLSHHAVPKAMSLQEIQNATKTDEELQELLSCLRSQNPQEKIRSSENMRPYRSILDEITEVDGALLRGSLLIVPRSLRQRVIDLAHRGHMGIVKTKQLIRQKVWFPGIDKMVEHTIKSCASCQAISKSSTRDPICPTPLPNNAWEHLVIDFAGPYPDGKYVLILIDEYSRFPIVKIIPSLNCHTVTKELRTIFTTFGLPLRLKSDNGAPFNSHEFVNFAKELSFIHHRVTPIWPEANGMAERGVQNLKKTIMAAHLEKRDVSTEIDSFLLNYRATPHTTTGISPFEALYGRKIRTSIPHIHDGQALQEQPKLRETDEKNKGKGKEYADISRHAKSHDIQLGDTVLVVQPKVNKLTTPYNPQPFTVIRVEGTKITAMCGQRTITRNASLFKKIRAKHNNNSGGEDLAEDSADESTVQQDPRADDEPPPPALNHPNQGRPQARTDADGRARRYPQRDTREPHKFNDYVMH